ncbi:hypothetical protein B4U80_13596 [Leptotrombidium deliense]|uniref:PH domain-containing protein n=1 Tax=Leptotrombidium deliense TaxID=299467 RepID=A0A443SV64_9ACAR|nr:hypothetical protein B4U80_13596 [Leptotrombidium deliense]
MEKKDAAKDAKVNILKKGILFEKKELKLRGLKLSKVKLRYLILTNDLLNCFKYNDEKKICGKFLFSIKLKLILDSLRLIGNELCVNEYTFTCNDVNELKEWFTVLKQQTIHLKAQELKRNEDKLKVVKKSKEPIYTSIDFKQTPIHYSTIGCSYSSRFTPRLAPQCKGTNRMSTLSTSTTTRMLSTPHSLLISPSLTQRSLYAQQILAANANDEQSQPHSTASNRYSLTKRLLNSPSFLSLKCTETANGLQIESKSVKQSKMKSASSEFSFIKLNQK